MIRTELIYNPDRQLRTQSRLLRDKVLILSFLWMLSSELLRSQQRQGRHGGLGLALVSPAPGEVHPEPVVSHQQQEGSVQRPGVKQSLWWEIFQT